MQTNSISPPAKATPSSSIIPFLILGVGFVFLAFDVFISGGWPTPKSIALIIGSASYLLLRRRISPNLDTVFTAKPLVSIPNTTVVLNTLFFSIFAYTLFIAVNADAYIVPVSYFYCLTAMCLILVMEIFLMPEGRGPHLYIILAKVIVISLLLIAVPHYFFPNIGQDFFEHSALVSDMLAESHIPSTGYEYYRDFLAMHFVVAAVKSVTNLNVNSSMMLMGVYQVTSLLCLFCLGRTVIGNSKAALLGALFAGFSAPFILWGYYVIPMTLGTGLLAVMLFLLIKSRTSDSKIIFTLLWLFLSLFLVYTHTISATIFLIVIVAMYLADQFLHFWSKRSLPRDISYSVPLWFLFVLIGYWVYISRYWFGEVAQMIAHVFDIPAFEVTTLSGDITPILLQNVGFTGMLVLSIFASLYCLEHRKNYRYALLLVAALIGMYLVLFASSLLGNPDILLPHRWEPSIYVIMAVLSAYGIFLIYQVRGSKPVRLFGVAMITLFLSFTMISTSLTGHSNPTVNKQESCRNYWLESEVAAAARITEFYQGQIVSDASYNAYIELSLKRDTEEIYPLIDEGLEVNNALVIRDYILNYPFRVRFPEGKMGYSTYLTNLDETQKYRISDLAEKPGYNKIYSNGEVTTYLPRAMNNGQ
jgi:hypothetical protein